MRGVFAPKILLPLLAVGAVGFGTVGVMNLLQRRGEAAIGLIPADATLVISFDNTPAASQVLLFNEISAAMEDSGVNRLVDDLIEDSGMPPEARAIKDNLKGSFALGVWGDLASGKPDTLLAAALNDPASAESIVAKHAEKLPNTRVTAYTFEEDVVIAFHDDYVIVANSVNTIERAIDASEDKIESLDQAAAYKKARESLPREASLMVFVNGEAVARSDEDTRKMYEAFGIKKAGWAALSATVLAEGIQVDMFQDMEGGGRILEAYESLSDLNYDSAQKLPSGAIGIVGLSGAGTMIKTLVESIEASELAADFSSGVDEMEKDTGLSLEKDLIPALAGESYAAIYPPKKADEEPTFVIMFDEQNGANPENAARKIIKSVDDFTMSQVGEAEVFVNGVETSDEPVIAILPDRVVVTNDRSLVSAPQGNSLTSNGGLASFDEGEPAKFKLQIDMKAVFEMVRKFGGDEMPDLEQALSQQTLDCSWTVEDGVAKGRALLPFKLPELIRIIGKQASQMKKDFDAPPMSEESFKAMPESDDIDTVKAHGSEIGRALMMFSGDNDDKMPTLAQFDEGAIDRYLGDKSIREDFLYTPPMAKGEPSKTEAGYFIHQDGRVVVFRDGHVEVKTWADSAPER
ncbi:MAG: DUF3352 domain-containing protein [Armatimonadota bacterium]|nr:DUF3352 domain-containing protein [Armatimonadota bacterium]